MCRTLYSMLSLLLLASPCFARDGSDDTASSGALRAVRDAGGLVQRIAADDEALYVNFSIGGREAGDEILPHLAALGPIADLDLGRTRITDAGLEKLASLEGLQRLNLKETGITDAGLVHLRALDTLHYLNLYGTGVTDAGLVHLEKLTTLRRLFVWNSGVTEEAARALEQKLSALTVLGGWEGLAVVVEEGIETGAEKSKKLADAHFDSDSCCDKARKEDKACSHPCCVEAAEAGTVCAKCNPDSAAAATGSEVAEESRFDDGSCCDKAAGDGKECSHPCCVEAASAGGICTSCNPGAVDKLSFKAGSCCDTASQAGKQCEHACCVEARKLARVCDKCN